MATEKITVQFNAVDNISNTLTKIKGNFDILGGVLKFIGAYFTAGAIFQGLKTFINQAREAEIVQRQLTARLDAFGLSSSNYTTQVKLMAESLQQITNFTDEQAIQTFTHLLNLTNDYSAAMRYTKTAMDLAEATSLDLATATRMLGYAYEGNTGMLNRYIRVNLEGKKGLEALDVIMEKVAGTAEKTIDPVKRLGNAWGEFFETIGRKMTPLVNKMAGVLTSFAEAWTEILQGPPAEDEGLKELYAMFTKEGIEKEIISTTQTISAQTQMWIDSFDNVKKFLNDNWLPTVVNTFGYIGEAIGLTAMGATDAWANAAKSMLLSVLDFAQNALMAMTIVNGVINPAMVPAAIAGTIAIQTLKAIAGQIGTRAETTTATTTATRETQPNTSVITPSPVNQVGGSININIYNPTFLDRESKKQTILELFKIAEELGYELSRNTTQIMAEV